MAQLIFGRFFWAWVLSFLAMSSYFTALSVNQLVRLSITKFDYPEQTGGNKLKDDSPTSKAKSVLSGINLMDPNNSMVVPPPKPPDKRKATTKKKKKKIQDEFGCPAIEEGQEIPETKLKRARLKGTSYSDDPSVSMAAIFVRVRRLIPPKTKKDESRPPRYRMVWEVEFYRTGDIIMPSDARRRAKLCVIGPREIILLRRNKLERMTLDSKKKRLPLYYGSIGVGLGEKKAKGPGEVKVRDGDKFSISRATVNGWLANPMQHAMSARIMPHYENGKPGGLRLVWVRKKSLYSQIGLKSGDVVQQINGKTLSVGTALGLYSELPYAKQIRVNVIRKGVRRTLLYNVK
ncbi:MAG: hypothetical protein EP343_18270 [Deltaproteobacteria bacterium]|nr:MAG: hypothetical protein EP343_18270 [Deltaproteobacteria bacterium]